MQELLCDCQVFVRKEVIMTAERTKSPSKGNLSFMTAGMRRKEEVVIPGKGKIIYTFGTSDHRTQQVEFVRFDNKSPKPAV